MHPLLLLLADEICPGEWLGFMMDLWWVYDGFMMDLWCINVIYGIYGFIWIYMDLFICYGICDMSSNKTNRTGQCCSVPQNPLKSLKAYPSGHWLWEVESDATTPGRCPLWRVRGSARCYRTWWCKRPGCAARRRARGGTSPERSPLRRPNPGPSQGFWVQKWGTSRKNGENWSGNDGQTMVFLNFIDQRKWIVDAWSCQGIISIVA